MKADLASFKMGKVDDFGNFVNAVIDERSFDKITSYIAEAKNDSRATIIAGGNYDKTEGFFIEPTLLLQVIQITRRCVKNCSVLY